MRDVMRKNTRHCQSSFISFVAVSTKYILESDVSLQRGTTRRTVTLVIYSTLYFIGLFAKKYSHSSRIKFYNVTFKLILNHFLLHAALLHRFFFFIIFAILSLIFSRSSLTLLITPITITLRNKTRVLRNCAISIDIAYYCSLFTFICKI